MSILISAATPALFELSGGSHSVGGLISLSLIFFASLAALAMVGDTRSRGPMTCLPGAIVFVLALVAAWHGGWLGGAGLVFIVVYALWRAAQVIRRGRGALKFLLALLLVAYAGFALIDFAASRVADTPAMVHLTEHKRAVSGLKTLASAERVMTTAPDMVDHKAGAFADAQTLYKYRLIDEGFINGKPRNGYLYKIVVAADGRHFTASAAPAVYKGAQHDWLLWLPGVALSRALHPRVDNREGGVLSFMLDESGVVKAVDAHGAAADANAQWSDWRNPEEAQ